MPYLTDWKPVKYEDRHFKCKFCGSHEVYYRIWESHCGGYEDYKYECKECCGEWWIDGDDG